MESRHLFVEHFIYDSTRHVVLVAEAFSERAQLENDAADAPHI